MSETDDDKLQELTTFYTSIVRETPILFEAAQPGCESSVNDQMDLPRHSLPVVISNSLIHKLLKSVWSRRAKYAIT